MNTVISTYMCVRVCVCVLDFRISKGKNQINGTNRLPYKINTLNIFKFKKSQLPCKCLNNMANVKKYLI